MSYLETQVNKLRNNYVPPAKEGGLEALNGKKIWSGLGVPIYTVPLFHHSFNLWKKAVLSNSDYVLHQVITRCKVKCQYDVHMLQGSNSMPNQQYLQKCVDDCHSNWMSIYNAGLRVSKKEKREIKID